MTKLKRSSGEKKRRPQELLRNNKSHVKKKSKHEDKSNLDLSNQYDTIDNSPIIIKTITYKPNEKVPSISLTPDLDTLMYPIPKSMFLDRCLRQRAVHIKGPSSKGLDHADARVNLLRQEMYNLEAESILRETSSDNIFLWLRRKEQMDGNDPRDLIQSIEVSDVDTAIALHKTAGHATYCRAPPRVEQSLVSSLLRSTGLGCGQYDPAGESFVSLARGEVETFISTPGHLTNWHFDFQENFTIQLSGTKRWTLQQGTIQDPLRGCTPHYASPGAVESQLKAANLFDRKFRFGHPKAGVNATGQVVVIDVKPGDVLYFPAGMWHKVETLEPGVSINVSLMATNYATVVTQALHHFLLQNPEWRQPILNNTSENVVHRMGKLLASLPAHIKQFSSAVNIIPPILQHPPRFEMEEVSDTEDNSGQQTGDSIDSSGGSDAEEDSAQEDSSRTSSQDFDEEVVDLYEFHFPEGWDSGLKVGTTYELKRNPLELLHKLEEINSFYGHNEGYQDEKESTSKTFVYNCNYAGNEMH